jgi:HEAT repeat protein
VKDSRLIEPLIAALEDEIPLVRLYAIWGLRLNKNLRAVGPLIAALKDKQTSIRGDAAETLGELKDVRAVEPLIAVLNDEDWGVRSKADLALSRITGKDLDGIKEKWLEWWQKNRGKISP